MITYIEEMRPKNWLKNVFVFIPLLFSLELFNGRKFLAALLAAAAFCFISSAVYVFNDINDMARDALHPRKRFRPIASGAISKGRAIAFMAALAAVGIGLCLLLGVAPAVFAALYLALNAAYSLRLKHEAILDCFCIAAGFVLRIYTGGTASGTPVSDWLFLTVVAMSLFMAFGKRRGEELRQGGKSPGYDAGFLEGAVFVCAGLAIVFYALWAMNRGRNMIYTVPFVIFIVTKYLLLIRSGNSYGDPTSVILGDKPLMLSCAVYGIVTVALLYIG